ncbi:unnamed protein product [Symbiodinium microadriaticum]|nr:unnamed protein product [Symbiodinium microadriaticum]CAE7939004.1 unnamed protein product [Symbiodinium sp. KB8]
MPCPPQPKESLHPFRAAVPTRQSQKGCRPWKERRAGAVVMLVSGLVVTTSSGPTLMQVPAPDGRDPMWNSDVESRHGREEPKVGKTYHCWCCCWLREVQRQQQQGSVIFCATSNIFEADWIELHSAASSELSDTDAKALQVPREEFRNGQPEGWGKDSLEVHFVAGRVSMNRKAPVQDASTNLPMGGGCRWERRVLDQQDFPVYVFPAP